MTHRRIHSRLLASMFAGAIALPMALGAVALTPAVAEAAATKATCDTKLVLLTKEGSGVIPKELEALRSTLQEDEFAVYKGFHLLESKALKLSLDTKAESTFSSGHRLGLTLLGGDDTRLKLHADLSNRDATKSLLSTDYSIEDNGLLMIGAGAYTDGGRSGKLFFAIQCGRAS